MIQIVLQLWWNNITMENIFDFNKFESLQGDDPQNSCDYTKVDKVFTL